MKIVHLYPELLNLYGEAANLLVLQRTLQAAGHAVDVETVAMGETLHLNHVDFVYAGAGTERKLELARRALLPYAAELQSAAADGVPMLFTGSAAELTARTLQLPSGEVQPCLGLTDCDAVRTDGRQLGDVLYESPMSEQLLAGFINKSGYLQHVAAPLFHARFGPGGILTEDGAEAPDEGIRTGNVLATYVIGPVLARNPWLKRWLAAWLIERKTGQTVSISCETEHSDRAYEITVSELLKRANA